MSQMQVNILTDKYVFKKVKPHGNGASVDIGKLFLDEEELIAIPFIEEFINLNENENDIFIMLKTEELYLRKINSKQSTPRVNIPSKYIGREILIIPKKSSHIQTNILTKKFKIVHPTKNSNGLFIHFNKNYSNVYFTSIVLNNEEDVKIFEKENNLYLLEINPIEILTKKPLKIFDYCRLQLPIYHKNKTILLFKSEFQ